MKEEEREQRLRERDIARLRRKKNRPFTFVSVFFILIFVSLIGYLIYFDAIKSDDFINSPYNTRQDTFSDRVVRGSIQSSDGEVLAQTNVYEDGTEERTYPFANIFAHAVGYDTNGKSGLESEANFQLLTSHSFFLEQMKNEFLGKKNQGDTVISSLNADLQTTAYNSLGDRRGAVVVIEPSTGRILAMVSKPDFNPNTIAQDWDTLVNDENNSSLLNRATNGAYPPGSTFKVVTALDYFRQKGSLEGYSYLCQGSITVDDHTIQCYNGEVHGQEDFYSAFAHSCNCAFADMGLNLGAGSSRSTAEDLLFNKALPLNSYKTSRFTLEKKFSKRSGNADLYWTGKYAGVSYAYGTDHKLRVANDGVLMKPYHDRPDCRMIPEILVKRTRSSTDYKRLMTTNEARSSWENSCASVVTTGTASALNGRGYTVAGKTGSAEFDENGSSHSWFIGYSNVDNPDIAIAVIVENGGTGSEAAVPIAGDVFDAYYFD